MKKTRIIPAVFALTAAGITGIIGLICKTEKTTLLLELIIVLLVFFFLGKLAAEILDLLDKNQKTGVSEEGEVIEKEGDMEEPGEMTEEEK